MDELLEEKKYIPGKRRERISIIGGWIEKKFIAPITFTERCNKEVFNVWLEQILLPQLKRGTTIVMDNATFHKTAKTKELIEAADCHLLYLPTYSPDLNPIEHCWHTIKSRLRPLIHQYTNLQLLIGNTIMELYHLFLKVLYYQKLKFWQIVPTEECRSCIKTRICLTERRKRSH